MLALRAAEIGSRTHIRSSIAKQRYKCAGRGLVRGLSREESFEPHRESRRQTFANSQHTAKDPTTVCDSSSARGSAECWGRRMTSSSTNRFHRGIFLSLNQMERERKCREKDKEEEMEKGIKWAGEIFLLVNQLRILSLPPSSRSHFFSSHIRISHQTVDCYSASSVFLNTQQVI